jgi:hypothetical protein
MVSHNHILYHKDRYHGLVCRTLSTRAFSMMNFPSLYFWLASKAVSCRMKPPSDALRTVAQIFVWWERTYFHPSTVPHEQWMSETVCLPVMSRRSSLGPRTVLNLYGAVK